MKYRRSFGVLFFFMIGLIPVISTAKSLPLHTEGIAVIVEIPTSGGSIYGSGTYVSIENSMYFVTAKHVLFSKVNNNLNGTDAILTSYDDNHSTFNKIDLNITHLNNTKNILISPAHDIVAIKLTYNT